VQSRMPPSRASGMHESAVIPYWAGTRLIEAACDEPPRSADTMAVWLAAMLPAVAVKVAVVDVAPTFTEGGTIKALVLLASVTVPPPVFESVTVQVLAAPELRDDGEHASATTVMGVASAIEAVCVAPFSVAVMVAVRSLVKLPAVAVKVAVVAVAPTFTEGGTIKALVLLASVTVPPPVFESVTVQVLALPAVKVEGVQLNPDNAGGAGAVVVAGGGGAEVTAETIEPPMPVSARVWPSEVEAWVFVRPMEAIETPVASVTFREATTPSGITVAFRPISMQV
jgi:hypothetical protein